MSKAANLDRLIKLTLMFEQVRAGVDTSQVWEAIAAAKEKTIREVVRIDHTEKC